MEFASPTSHDLAEIFQLILDEVQPAVRHDEEVIWAGSPSGVFAIASAFNQSESPMVEWGNFYGSKAG